MPTKYPPIVLSEDDRRKLSQIIKGSIIIDEQTGCWLWQKNRDRHGYGVKWLNRRTVKVHRISYSLFTGDIPDGLQVQHICHVRHCCNPAHLKVGTVKDNALDMLAAGREPRTGPPPLFGESNPFFWKKAFYGNQGKNPRIQTTSDH